AGPATSHQVRAGDSEQRPAGREGSLARSPLVVGGSSDRRSGLVPGLLLILSFRFAYNAISCAADRSRTVELGSAFTRCVSGVKKLAGSACVASRSPNGHGILGWSEPAPIRGRVFSAWSRTWSGARRRETSGSPPGSGSPSCPGP